jgi:hypothetical protein
MANLYFIPFIDNNDKGYSISLVCSNNKGRAKSLFSKTFNIDYTKITAWLASRDIATTEGIVPPTSALWSEVSSDIDILFLDWYNKHIKK